MKFIKKCTNIIILCLDYKLVFPRVFKNYISYIKDKKQLVQCKFSFLILKKYHNIVIYNEVQNINVVY